MVMTTRQQAETDLKSIIRSDKRAGGRMGPEAVTFRRENARRMTETAKFWRTEGNMTNAMVCIRAARAQAIIARGLAKYLTK